MEKRDTRTPLRAPPVGAGHVRGARVDVSTILPTAEARPRARAGRRAVDVSTLLTEAAEPGDPQRGGHVSGATPTTNSPYSDDPPGSRPAWAPAPGDLVADRYELLAPLGRGGHGEVWTARDRVIGETVALKWMFQPGALRSARTRREIALLRMLRMPGVVSFVDEGVACGCAFVVMSVVRGAPFPGARARAGRGPSPWAEVAPATLSLLEVLSRVHARGVVHRDLKPANVLVEAEGRAVLLDFGVSHWHEADGPGRAGIAAGTPAYMAPEQRAGEPVDGRADLYSVGVMLFEAVTGELPFETDLPGLPPHVAAVLTRLLAPRPEDRFPSAEAVLRALEGGAEARASASTMGRRQAGAGSSERSLRALFAGPDRLFHLRSDAARALWRRTGGDEGRVSAEIDAWIRLGIARRTPHGLAVDRSGLAQLRLLRPSPEEPRSERGGAAQDPALSRVLAWLSLCVTPISAEALAEAMGEPPEEVNTICQQLVGAGSVRAVRGRLEALVAAPVGAPAGDTIAAQRRLAAALDPGDEGRLYHLIAAGDTTSAATESIALASLRARAGDLPLARAALLEGLAALRRDPLPRPDVEAAVLTEIVRLAFEDGTPMAHDLALYELSRSRVQGDRLRALELLVRAALVAPSGRLPEGFEALPAFEDEDIRRRCSHVSVLSASARVAPGDLLALLPPIEAWAASGSRPAALCLAESSAVLHYASGDFEAAARDHLAATRMQTSPAGRVAALLDAASALLEAFLHREAERTAAKARRLAVAHRHPLAEGRAEWLLRSARYRAGDPLRPDVTLVDAVDRLGVPKLAALVRLTEAAVALRAGDRALARQLAGDAATAWRQLGRTWGSLLSRSLAIFAGEAASAEEVARLRELALACPVPGIGLQALALVHGGGAAPAGQEMASLVQALARPIPPDRRHLRMDVLSADEAVARLRSPAPGP